MDDILEFVLELVLDLLFEASGNKKIPKWIRYPLIGLLALLACAMIGALAAAGISLMRSSPVAGVIVLAVVGLMIAGVALIIVRRNRKRKQEKDLEPLEREWAKSGTEDQADE